MPNVDLGGFIYVEFFALTDVSTFISIKKTIDAEDVVCNVQSGQILLLRHPYKMYMSF